MGPVRAPCRPAECVSIGRLNAAFSFLDMRPCSRHAKPPFVKIAEMQLELFQFDHLSDHEFAHVVGEIRRHYWHIRNLRGGRFGQARLRKHYRDVSHQKKRLLMAGVSKREILDLLACCRLQCSRHRHPFNPCQFCP